MKSTVSLESGKYVITYDDDNGSMKFFRNGEDWPAGNELRYTNVVVALVQRVIELEASTQFSAELVSTEPDSGRDAVLVDNEKFRMHMAAISTAAFGYCDVKELVGTEYDTPTLRDVVALYAKYEALFTAAHPANVAQVGPVAAQPVVQVPVAWRYEWASCITTDGPQDFRLKFEAEPPPSWAVADGQARNIVALYTTPVPAAGVQAEAIGDGSFFNLEGVGGTPDIEEDFGRLLVKVRHALDFVVNGPVAGMELPQEEIDKKFDDLVIKLIPEIDVMLQSRVMVKHPFWELADLFAKSEAPTGLNSGLHRYEHAANKLHDTTDCVARISHPSKEAEEVMDCLAYMATYMQVIMNLYGWRWDDVKLKARQEMAKAGV